MSGPQTRSEQKQLDAECEALLEREALDAENPLLDPELIGDWIAGQTIGEDLMPSDSLYSALASVERDPLRTEFYTTAELFVMLMHVQHHATAIWLLREVRERFEAYTQQPQPDSFGYAIMSQPLPRK